jgi:hypothetical protein
MVGNPAGTAQNVITPIYYGSAGSLFVSNPMGSAAFLIGPPVLAKFYTSKTGLKFLTEAVKTPVGSPNASQIFSKLSAILSSDEEAPKSDLERQAILKSLSSPTN